MKQSSHSGRPALTHQHAPVSRRFTQPNKNTWRCYLQSQARGVACVQGKRTFTTNPSHVAASCTHMGPTCFLTKGWKVMLLTPPRKQHRKERSTRLLETRLLRKGYAECSTSSGERLVCGDWWSSLHQNELLMPENAAGLPVWLAVQSAGRKGRPAEPGFPVIGAWRCLPVSETCCVTSSRRGRMLMDTRSRGSLGSSHLESMSASATW